MLLNGEIEWELSAFCYLWAELISFHPYGINDIIYGVCCRF